LDSGLNQFCHLADDILRVFHLDSLMGLALYSKEMSPPLVLAKAETLFSQLLGGRAPPVSPDSPELSALWLRSL
jgi:hypothetical protein